MQKSPQKGKAKVNEQPSIAMNQLHDLVALIFIFTLGKGIMVAKGRDMVALKAAANNM